MKSGHNGAIVNDLLKLGLVGLVFLGLALWVRMDGNHDYLAAAQRWAMQIAHDPSPWHRLMGFAGFVILGGALISLGLPRIWFSAAAGAIYGMGAGIPAALAASLMGSGVLFWLGKTFLGAVVQRRATGKMAVWRCGLQQNAFWWVLYLRLFPLSNTTFASLLCGSCRVPFNAYMGASLIGFLPFTIAFAAFGHGGFHGKLSQLLIGFALLGATIGIRKWLIQTQSNIPIPPES